jgi:heterodisulfide reductase subunit D
MPDANPEAYLKSTAEIVYFVGCVSSYSPRSFSIPRSITQIFTKTGQDFTLLGEDEWCCGFPLFSSGMQKEVVELANHNIKKVKEKKAKILITSCPSCYHTWKYEYPEISGEKIDFEIIHISQYLLELIKDKKIKLNPISAKVTYHDPCDLGRNSGIINEPREVIKSIPGVEFTELSLIGLQANCCGGGGNLESFNPVLSAKIADSKCTEIISTGADTIVSSCQQCERTISTAIRKRKDEIDYKIKVMDISELVNQSMG